MRWGPGSRAPPVRHCARPGKKSGCWWAGRPGRTPRRRPRRQIERAYRERGLVAALDLLTYVGRAITPSHSNRRFNTRFFLSDGANVFGEPASSEELEDVRWYPVGRHPLESFRDVTRFMLARAIALRSGTAKGETPLFYWAKNARRIGVCREAAEHALDGGQRASVPSAMARGCAAGSSSPTPIALPCVSTAEKHEGQSDQQHAEGEEQVSRQHRVRGRLRRYDVAGAGDQGQAQRADDLADAVRGLPEAGRARAETHPIALDRVGREIGEAALDEEGRGAQQDHHRRQPADNDIAVIAGGGERDDTAEPPNHAQPAPAGQRRQQGDDDLAGDAAEGDEDKEFGGLRRPGR